MIIMLRNDNFDLSPEQILFREERDRIVNKWNRVIDAMTYSPYIRREQQVVSEIRDLFIRHRGPLPVLATCKQNRMACERWEEMHDFRHSWVETNLWANGEIDAQILLDVFDRM